MNWNEDELRAARITAYQRQGVAAIDLREIKGWAVRELIENEFCRQAGLPIIKGAE